MRNREFRLGLIALVCFPVICLSEATQPGATRLASPTVICGKSATAINEATGQYTPDSFEISLLSQSHGAAAGNSLNNVDEKTICIVVKPTTK